MSLLIESLASRIRLGDVRPAPDGKKRAAVAVLLHDATSPRVLLMKRVEREGDPWSGHISLPGGGFHATDGDLLATAMRETREELGIDLTGARLLGNLEALHPRTSGPTGIQVTPFVFVTEAPVEPVCGPEALSAFWLPLDLAAAGTFNDQYVYPNTQMTFPAWSYEGHVIWGLTWRILSSVLEAAQPVVAAQ